jgi:ABC-type branched-subunit amino acid transport system ATPase component
MLGLALVPEKRELFGTMPVEDNLVLGGYRAMKQRVPHWQRQIEQVYELFPRLKERRAQLAGTLSGGERQMLAVGRALMSAQAADAGRTQPGPGAAGGARDLPHHRQLREPAPASC